MAAKKPALGRGLEALFGDIETSVPVERAAEAGDVSISKNSNLYIDIDEIKPNAMQPRQTFNPEKIEDLVASIETYGVLQPVILTKAQTGYELIAGERRWRAARKAGLRTIPAIIREVTDEEKALIAIIENLQRENLNTIEEANAYRTLINKNKMTQETVAKAVGKSRPHITNTLRTLGMPPEIVDLLRTGDLTLGHANALGAVKDRAQQVKLAEKITKNGLSVREAERLAASADRKQPTKKPQSVKSNEIRIVEQELTSATGVRVVISGDGKKGSVELRYHDRQGLEEIIELLRLAGTKQV